MAATRLYPVLLHYYIRAQVRDSRILTPEYKQGAKFNEQFKINLLIPYKLLYTKYHVILHQCLLVVPSRTVGHFAQVLEVDCLHMLTPGCFGNGDAI